LYVASPNDYNVLCHVHLPTAQLTAVILQLIFFIIKKVWLGENVIVLQPEFDGQCFKNSAQYNCMTQILEHTTV
jgi:hypothetical protein